MLEYFSTLDTTQISNRSILDSCAILIDKIWIWVQFANGSTGNVVGFESPIGSALSQVALGPALGFAKVQLNPSCTLIRKSSPEVGDELIFSKLPPSHPSPPPIKLPVVSGPLVREEVRISLHGYTYPRMDLMRKCWNSFSLLALKKIFQVSP